MLGFKNYDCAATTIAGIELLHRIRKNQFAFGQLRLKRHVRARSLERSPCDIADASSGALLSLIQICTRAIESVYPSPLEESRYSFQDIVLRIYQRKIAPFVEGQTWMRDVEAEHVSYLQVCWIRKVQIGMLIH